MLLTLAIAGIAGIAIGSFAAALADVFPTHRRSLHDSGSGLLVVGITLLGCMLPLI